MTNVFQRPAYRRLLLVLRRLGYAEDTLNLVEAAFVRLGAGRSDGTAFKPRPPAQRDQRSRWQWQSQIAARRERRVLRRALAAHWQSPRGAEKSEAARIREAILGLPTDERAAFLLSRFRGMNCEQIAEIRGDTAENVESMLARALVRLVQETAIQS